MPNYKCSSISDTNEGLEVFLDGYYCVLITDRKVRGTRFNALINRIASHYYGGPKFVGTYSQFTKAFPIVKENSKERYEYVSAK